MRATPEAGRSGTDATKTRDAEEPSLIYEISLKNADKGVIDVEQAEERLSQFRRENAGPR